MFTLKTAKVIGTPNGEAWSQVHDFKVEGEKLERRGKLLVVLTLKEVGEGVEAVVAGREILARINEEYYGNLEGSPFEGLQTILKKLDKEVNNLELVVAAFYQKVGYFGVLGRGRMVIKRESRIQTILGLNSDSRILIGSGYLEEGDIFLLGSSKFFEMVAEGIWRAVLGAGEPEEMVETLAPVVAGREKAGGIAVGIAKIEGEAEPRIGSVVIGDTEIETPSVLLQRARRTPQRLTSAFSVIGRVFSKLFGKLIRFRPRSVFVSRRVDQQKQKKTLLTVAAILIFLLLVSVILGVRKRAVEQQRAKEEEIIIQVKSQLEEAKGLVVISPSGAKKILQQAQRLLDESSKSEARGSRLPSLGSEATGGQARLEVLREEIETELAKAVKEFKLTEPPVFLDLFVVRQDAQGDDLALSGDRLVVLDKEKKRVIEIDIDNKSAKILAGGEDLVGASRVAAHEDKTYTLAEKGIWETKADKTSLVVEKDEKWGEVVDLAIYEGNLYLLDQANIYRYLVTENGLGVAQNWFKGSSPDLSKVTSFAVDGAVWISRENVSMPIMKFASGIQQSFLITGLERPLISPSQIYTNENISNLYILDKDNYRVVVLDKEGSYQASYLWVGIADVQDMVVSEENKIILLLAKNKIYQIVIR